MKNLLNLKNVRILNNKEQKSINGSDGPPINSGLWFATEQDCINSGGEWIYSFGGYHCVLGEVDKSHMHNE